MYCFLFSSLPPSDLTRKGVRWHALACNGRKSWSTVTTSLLLSLLSLLLSPSLHSLSCKGDHPFGLLKTMSGRSLCAHCLPKMPHVARFLFYLSLPLSLYYCMCICLFLCTFQTYFCLFFCLSLPVNYTARSSEGHGMLCFPLPIDSLLGGHSG